MGLGHSNSNGALKANPMNFGNNSSNMNLSQNFVIAKNSRLDQNDSNLQNEERNTYFNDFKIADPRNNHHQVHTQQNRSLGSNILNNGFMPQFQPEYGPNFGNTKVNYQQLHSRAYEHE